MNNYLKKMIELNKIVDGLQKRFQLKGSPIGYSGYLGIKSIQNYIKGNKDSVRSQIMSLKENLEIITDKKINNWVPKDDNVILFSDKYLKIQNSDEINPELKITKAYKSYAEGSEIQIEAEKARHLPKVGMFGEAYAYMVAGGIPEAKEDHCEAVALCALEMQNIMHKGISKDLQNFKVRIGIHTGPVVAGVIGKSKFIYDLWGDSVNTASRMESHGVEDKIHVSKEVYLKLRNKFEFEDKREIHVKGKGIMETYFLVRERV